MIVCGDICLNGPANKNLIKRKKKSFEDEEANKVKLFLLNFLSQNYFLSGLVLCMTDKNAVKLAHKKNACVRTDVLGRMHEFLERVQLIGGITNSYDRSIDRSIYSAFVFNQVHFLVA